MPPCSTSSSLSLPSPTRSSNTYQLHHRRPELDRWRIIVYFYDGQTISEVAVRLRCSRNTVYRWIKSFRRDHMSESIGSRGRKRKLTDDQVTDIVEHVKRVKFTTPRQIKYIFDLDVCNRTIDRMLIENNLFGRVARKRHPLMNPKKRLSFAEGNRTQSLNFVSNSLPSH